MSTLTLPMPGVSGDQLLLHGVGWDDYTDVLDQIGERRIFVTFDGENIEIMSPSADHDRSSEVLGQIVWVLAEELDVRMSGLGSTTLRKEETKRGLEPDRCFYTTNEPKIRGRKRLDLRRDPPPDLAIEVEVTRRLLDRESIYERLKVPELWRYDARAGLRVFTLVRGRYVQQDRSPTFPSMPIEEISKFVAANETQDHTAWVRAVRAWVRKHLVAHPSAPRRSRR